MKILIAEDEPISRLALEATVPQWGFVPVTVANGQEALARLTARHDPPPMAILDWMMPGMDGVDVCRAVRSSMLPVAPYIVILTTRTEQSDIIAGLQAGADDYVRKPFDRIELQARLQVGMRVIKLQQQLLERVHELEEGHERERALRRLLPICAYCRRIRDDQDYWQALERYVAESGGVRFSHGVCPDCAHKVEEELAAIRESMKRE
jgi:DNA-binding response OmpR family regulator